MIDRRLIESRDLLKEIGILLDHSYLYQSKSYVEVNRDISYLEQWEFFYKEKLYDFRLMDHSLLQFKMSDDRLSYKFYECPYSLYVSLHDYIIKELRTDIVTYDQFLYAEYSEYLQSLQKDNATPIRYDFDPINITRIHPTSHFHFGLNNEIRIKTERKLTPLAFILFIIRQVYPEYWMRLVRMRNNTFILNNIRITLDLVSSIPINSEEEILLV